MSLLIFLLYERPLTLIVRVQNARDVFYNYQQNVSRLLFVDDFKHQGKAESQIISLVDMMYTFCADIRMDSELKRCDVFLEERHNQMD